MVINTRYRDNVAILDVKGEIIGDNRFLLIEAVLERIDAGIIINLEECPMGDGVGFGMLAAVHIQLFKKGGKLVLLNMNRSLRSLLVVTRLDDLFEKFDDEDEAFASFEEVEEGAENRQREQERIA